MSSFIRRFLFDPGATVLLNIESVNILDLQPPGAVRGVGSGAVLLVAELENGPFGVTTEVTSPTDVSTEFGTLGFTYNGVPSNFPCAVARKADGALVPEFWNGNGFVQMNGKQFARLFLCRVNTSVGSVQFSRLAFLNGAAAFRYALAPGQILSVDVGAGFTSATFTATAATVTAIGGVYPTTFTGVETLTLGYDGAPNFTVQFLASDQTIGAVIARINQYAGFTFADNNAGQIRLTSLQQGNAAQVRVVSASAPGVLTQLGLTVATTLGTGNVGNILAVTPGEIASVVQLAIANTKVEQTSSGNLRISNTGTSGFITVGPATTATALGFFSGAFATSIGQAVLQTGLQTFPTTFAGGETLVLSIDGGPQVTVTFLVGDQTQANVVSRINAAFTNPVCATDGATHMIFFGANPGGSVNIISASALVLTKLGLSVGVTTGVLPPQGLLPAGTVVQNPTGGTLFVTMQDLTFAGGQVTINSAAQPLTLTQVGPWTVPVRPAVDDGTGLAAGAGTVTQVNNPPDIGSFSVINLGVISAALTEGQIDAQYTLALNATLNLNDVSKQTNIVYAARQSNTVRRQLKVNALTASANGLQGRMAIVRTPLNTTRSLAMSTVAEPGVGAYRDQRVIFCYPQANSFVPLIGLRGLAGGQGFTANGNVDIGADGFLASIMSQLPPEENPGQDTPFAAGVNSIELGANAQGFQMQDYINFKAAGICALRIDDGVATFQSGVTSVDPNTNAPLVNIARRRMADFIQDSLAARLKGFGKRLSTNLRRKAITIEIRQFLEQLLSKNNPSGQRINGFKVDPNAGNTATLLGQGLFRIIVNVQTIASLDSIVLQTTIGEQVTDVNEVLPQAA
jgi:hypothetical protein